MSEVNYNDGKWHGWNGGECPVHPESEVEIMFPDGTKTNIAEYSGSLRWSHLGLSGDIEAFRVVKEHKEPRDFWIGNDTILGLPDIKTVETKGYIHVREVM